MTGSRSTGKWFDRTILLLIVVQAVLWYNFYSREVAWYPPSNFDQTGYLATAYYVEHNIRANGLVELLRAIGSRGHQTGLALPIEGAISALIFGGTRLPQLFIIFLGICALQVVAFAMARKIWGSRTYGYMLLGLILCQITPWYWAGGLFDFIFDLIAYCLYGIWVCAAMRSNLFLDRRWAIGCGLIGAFLVLHRFLTIVYLVGVCAGFAVFCLAIAFLWRADGDLVRRMRSRFYNLGLCVGVLTAISFPFFIRNWEWIYNYYLVGHGVSPEKDAYARQLGIGSLTDHLLFYPLSIIRDHWGSIFLLGSAIAVLGALIAHLVNRPKAPAAKMGSRQDETFLLQVIFLLGTILGPIVVLTVDIEKSPVVGGIVGVPAALLVVALAARAGSVFRNPDPSPGRKFIFACALVIFSLGVANQLDHSRRHLPEYAQRRELTRLLDLHQWVIDYASDHGWSTPAISFDVLSPWFQCGGITDTGLMRSGKFVWFRLLLGAGGMTAVERPEALSLLSKSDFVILTSRPKAEGSRDGLFVDASSAAIRQFPNILLRVDPFSEHIAQYWNDLKAWADKNMIVAKTVPFDNFTATVYVRPDAKLSANGASLPEGHVLGAVH
jgi:hypothetical protein